MLPHVSTGLTPPHAAISFAIMPKYTIVEHTDEIGRTKFAVYHHGPLGKQRIQRPLELAHGMTDPFSRDEAIDLIERHSESRKAILSEEEIEMPGPKGDLPAAKETIRAAANGRKTESVNKETQHGNFFLFFIGAAVIGLILSGAAVLIFTLCK